jgi:hypothetical protein
LNVQNVLAVLRTSLITAKLNQKFLLFKIFSITSIYTMNPIETPNMKPRKLRVKKDLPSKEVAKEVAQEVEPVKSEVKKVPKEQKEQKEHKEQKEQKEPKVRKPNPWLLYTKKIQTENPELSYKAVLSLAKTTYKK